MAGHVIFHVIFQSCCVWIGECISTVWESEQSNFYLPFIYQQYEPVLLVLKGSYTLYDLSKAVQGTLCNMDLK